jgi:uncharacterized membrane protein YdbT with pleckstrin-like domain
MAVLWEGEGKSLVAQASQGVLGSKKYTITDEYIYSEVGSLSSRGEQIPLWAVRDVDFRQTLVQKARGVATITVRTEHNDYTGTGEIALEDVAAGMELRNLINNAAQAARLAYQQRSQTQHVTYQGAVPTVVAPAAPAAEPSSNSAADKMQQLEKLADMYSKGLLTDDEFASMKKALLAS